MATGITLLAVEDIGNDVLRVRACIGGVRDEDGNLLPNAEARGWVSAMTHHYDPEDYGEDGHLLPDATARAMTTEERRAYCEGLIRAQNPRQSPPAPVDLGAGLVT